MDEFAAYVLFSEHCDHLYIGSSGVSLQRFYWHNFKATKGFTIRFRPWKMIHIEIFESRAEALKREMALKTGQGRNWIRQEIIPSMIRAGFISA